MDFVLDNGTLIGNQSNASYLYPFEAAIPKWTKLIIVSFMSVVFAIGVPGNGLLLHIIRTEKHRTTTDYYILALTSSDLVCVTVYSTLNIIRMNAEAWQLFASDMFCRIYWIVAYSTGISSNFLLSVIAIDRYIKTCKPLSLWYNQRIAQNLCVLVLSISVFIASPTIVVYELSQQKSCDSSYKRLTQIYKYIVGIIVIINQIILIVTYVTIRIHMRRMFINKVRNSTKTLAHSKGGIKLRRKCLMRLCDGVEKDNEQNGPMKSQNILTIGLQMNATDRSNKMSAKKVENIFQTSCRADPCKSKYCPPITSIIRIDPRDTRNISVDKQPFNPSSIHDFGNNANYCEVNVTNTTNSSSQRAIRTHRENVINKTTLTMFIVSLVYVITHILAFIAIYVGEEAFGETVIALTLTLHTINCFINPIVFYCVSSRFRQRFREVFMRRRN